MRLLQWNWSWNWNPRPKTHFAIVLTVTLLATILSIVAFLYSYRQITQNPIVEGIVVKSVTGGDDMQTPIIEYSSPTNDRKRFKSKLRSNRQLYFVGDRVEVILIGSDYKPKLKSFLSVYGLSAFLALFASISAVSTTVIYNSRIKSRERNK